MTSDSAIRNPSTVEELREQRLKRLLVGRSGGASSGNSSKSSPQLELGSTQQRAGGSRDIKIRSADLVKEEDDDIVDISPQVAAGPATGTVSRLRTIKKSSHQQTDESKSTKNRGDDDDVILLGDSSAATASRSNNGPFVSSQTAESAGPSRPTASGRKRKAQEQGAAAAAAIAGTSSTDLKHEHESDDDRPAIKGTSRQRPATTTRRRSTRTPKTVAKADPSREAGSSSAATTLISTNGSTTKNRRRAAIKSDEVKKESTSSDVAGTVESKPAKNKKVRKNERAGNVGYTLAGDVIVDVQEPVKEARERKWRSKCSQATLQRGESAERSQANEW